MTSERARQALAMRLSGHTYAEIGKELGISRQRAQQLVYPQLDECPACAGTGRVPARSEEEGK